MNIQEILFPEVGKCTERELYFHSNHPDSLEKDIQKTCFDKGDPRRQLFDLLGAREAIELDMKNKTLTFAKNAEAVFDTYFNGFTIEKWRKYTVVNKVSLSLRLSGKFAVTLICKEKIHEEIIESVLLEEIVESKEETIFRFDYTGDEGKGIYSFKLRALSDNAVFYGGCYESDVPEEKVRYTKIGIGICTFRREAFIEKNMKLLNQSILKNPTSPMHGHLEVFISDNGKTLDIDRLETDKIHIYPNRNYGGAGGFTRDLIEMMTNNDKWNVTHALLMDDDIVIEPEALVKTYQILSLLKDEYVDAFIGGAMLRRDIPYRQVESGATWNGGQLESLKRNLDLRITEDCLNNEWEEYTEFNAWWYCCFPMSVVREDNLPLPIFIRGDDLEYGLRNMKHLILMNGICVWHEPFENKYSSFLEYYIMRNQLIDNSFHCPWYGAKQLIPTMMYHCVLELMLYRYKNVELYLQGIKDFLKGPEWLMQQDSEQLHKKIMAAGYRGEELSKLDVPFRCEQYKASRVWKKESKLTVLKRCLTFNGVILRAKGNACVPMANAVTVQTYRKKKVLFYDITSKKGFVTEKSFGKSMKYLFKAIGTSFEVMVKMKGAQQKYRTEGLRLRTLDFWKGFLGLDL